MESLRQSTENLSKSTESLKEKPEPPLEENPKQELEEPIQEQEQEPEKELIQEKEPEKEEEPLNDIPKEKVEEKIITPPQLEQEQQKIEDNRDSSFDSLEDSQIDIEMTTKIETFVPPEITFAGQQNGFFSFLLFSFLFFLFSFFLLSFFSIFSLKSYPFLLSSKMHQKNLRTLLKIKMSNIHFFFFFNPFF